MRSFRTERRIRFSDCDPAGIVFYPQYFVLFNGAMEDWVDALGVGFADLVTRRRIGLPSVHIEADFQAPSRVGDAVHLLLEVERLGSRSLTLDWRCVAARDGEVRMRMRQVVVTTSLETHRAVAIPPDLRAAIEGDGPSLPSHT
ncbi:thioesterase family protein [Ramlibacter monticola]|uniref:Acyl-CoA thioesterase n=1 Tax=Ramlibacter monticola TaxID=1926872 RepID=A0A936Z551_9BURK|nr:thioesterase family protein [Ramlibacter monticola]MBL0393895.1 acyl-CoA thioesterase [Ramlibacter monticola]